MKERTIAVDPERCKKDGLCARVCPVGVFSAEPMALAEVGETSMCVLCGQCIAVCPGDAITHGSLDPDRFSRIQVAAHARGLGTCWNGYLQKAACGFLVLGFDKMRRFLGVPDHHDVFAASVLGWPVVRLHSEPHRETSVRFVEPQQD